MNKFNRTSVTLACLLLAGMIFVNACQPVGEEEEINNNEQISEEEQTPVVGTRVGDIAPDFQLQNFSGDNFSLNGLRGTPVLLNFWASWCGPCVGEMPYLQEIYEEYDEDTLFLLCVNLGDTSEKVAVFMDENELTLPVLLDIRSVIGNMYGIIGLPTTYFIDKDGIIRGKVVGAFRTKSSIERYLADILE